MADPTGLNGLPFEYQSQIEAANRRKMLAEALQKQAFGFQGAQGAGRIMPKTSPLAWLANTATGYLASKGQSEATQQQMDVLGQAQKDRSAEMLALLQAPEDQQQALGVQGKFPETSALAKTLYDRKQEKLKAVMAAIEKASPQDAANIGISGKLPERFDMPPPKLPTFGKDPSGNAYGVTQDPFGKTELKFAPQPPQIHNNIPAAENRMGIDVLEKGLKPREEAAGVAKNVLGTTARAVDALQRGAQAGGAQDIKQVLRMGAQALGINVPDTAETADLQLALESAILANAEKLKPISNTDIPTLRNMLGSIGTDPQALSRVLAYQQAGALQGLQNFNRYLKEQGDTVTDPTAKQRLSGAGIGYEIPGQLSGPLPHQLEVVRQMGLIGGDVSAFRDPTGRPFSPTDKINVNPAGGYPGVKAPKVNKPIKPASQMTPEERAAEISSLRQQLGIGQ